MKETLLMIYLLMDAAVFAAIVWLIIKSINHDKNR